MMSVTDSAVEAAPANVGEAMEERSGGMPEDSGEENETIAGPVSRFLRGIASVLDWLFGFLAILGGLAVLSVVPVLNLLSLGYLLEVSGRIARTGKFSAGFIGIRKASVLGSIVAVGWLFLLPVRFLSGLWKDAELIAPGSGTATAWQVATIVVTVLILAHLAWAVIRGGRPWHFLWPAPVKFFRWLKTPGKYARMRDATVDYVLGLKLPYFFWLGLRGFVGAVAWLALPVGVLFLASQAKQGPGALLSLLGAGLMLVSVLYLPFLQARFAQENRFRAMFEVGAVRRLFGRAPLAFWLAFFILLLFSLPLYLLKIPLTPREVAWLPALIFVIFIFPARLLTGWAMARATKRPEERPAFWGFRWLSRLAALPVAAAYVLFVYLTQYLTFSGTLSLLEQHAFLVPAPLVGL